LRLIRTGLALSIFEAYVCCDIASACGVNGEQVKLAEGQYVTNVLLTVLRELEEELGDISSLRILRSTYRAAIDDIAPWLTARPDTADKLKAVRDSVRANKSELRHLLAFKQDLEDEVGFSCIYRCRCHALLLQIYCSFIHQDELYKSVKNQL
jgi:hypothetical protein